MACQLTACFIFAFACWMSSEAKAPQLKALSHYRAAVFQHSRVKNGECPVWSMMQNVQRYRQIAIHAAAEGAEIIVFPEIGLGGNAISRKINMRFGEDVPDAKDQLTPCNFLNTTYCSNRPALCSLSCMAQDVRAYIVVGMNDKKVCNGTVDPQCPKDGAYLFNTAVVFSPNGLVIARYHKKHIFTPFPVFDTPKQAEVRYFDTTFGVRFGIFICFDALFPDPPLELVKQGIAHFVFPTSWENIAPLLSATQFQQAWSRAFNTSFLASNTAEKGTSGSGIYACGHPITSFFNASADGVIDEKLLIADVPVYPCDASTIVEISDTSFVANLRSKTPAPLVNKISDFRGGNCGTVGIDPCACDLVDAAPGKTGTLFAELNGLACSVNYSFSMNQSTSERFGLIVYSGTAWFLQPLPLQLCTFVRCASENACLIPEVTGLNAFSSETLVDSFSIYGRYPSVKASVRLYFEPQIEQITFGNFSSPTEQQFVMLSVDGGQLLPKEALFHQENRISNSGDVWPQRLLAATILARPWNGTAF
eukprot:gene10839-2915_t